MLAVVNRYNNAEIYLSIIISVEPNMAISKNRFRDH